MAAMRLTTMVVRMAIQPEVMGVQRMGERRRTRELVRWAVMAKRTASLETVRGTPRTRAANMPWASSRMPRKARVMGTTGR